MSANMAETKAFQAETRRVLDIVINSLYTERDIFVRELVSNAADALEKYRHLSLTSKPEFDSHVPLEISIDCDDKKHTLTITDTGIGMTREELEQNLGTIAHSGSARFLERLAEGERADLGLIGQFGVGFYSVFMAGKRVRVQTRPWDGSEGWEWESDGGGEYTIRPCEGLHRGTRIIIELKEDARQYAQKFTIERIIQQYSNFVPFPIKVNGKEVNTIQAIWTRSQGEIKDEEYNEFYKFVAGAVDDPMLRLHFTADAPLAISALLYVPGENMEALGLGKLKSGVNLYCRRILIEQHCEAILPEWLRFLKGVVDSEDLPLNISRQALQDSALVTKLRRILTKRFLKFLAETADKDPDKYAEFWKMHGVFIKEGVTRDFEYRDQLAGLLRFESSATGEGEMTSLADYVSRMKEDQEAIYYINGASRKAIENGPYIETFRARGIELLYTLEPIDDFALNHLGEYEGKKLVSADRADLDMSVENEAEALDEDEARGLVEWIRERLGERIKEVKVSRRLVDSPAMITAEGMLTSSMERILRAAGQDAMMPPGEKILEINPANPLIRRLASLRQEDEDFAAEVLEQIHDSAMIQAGLLVDPQEMVRRNYRILERLSQA